MATRFPETPEQLTEAGIIRRLAAALYDTLICVALLMVTTGIYMAITAGILGADEYQKLNESGASLRDPLLPSVLFCVLFLFFGYFWTRTGQTLGMQVWHIRIQNRNNVSISWLQALLRYLMAWISWLTLGLGVLWMLIDKDHLTWADRFSESVVVRIPKRK